MDKPKAIQEAWDDYGYTVRSIARECIRSGGWEHETKFEMLPNGGVRITYEVAENEDMARQRRYAEEAEAKIKAWKEEVL